MGNTTQHVSGLTYNGLDGLACGVVPGYFRGDSGGIFGGNSGGSSGGRGGNVSSLLGSDGMMLPISPRLYDAFSQPEFATAISTPNTTVTPLGYAGEYRDARTGLR